MQDIITLFSDYCSYATRVTICNKYQMSRYYTPQLNLHYDDVQPHMLNVMVYSGRHKKLVGDELNVMRNAKKIKLLWFEFVDVDFSQLNCEHLVIFSNKLQTLVLPPCVKTLALMGDIDPTVVSAITVDNIYINSHKNGENFIPYVVNAKRALIVGTLNHNADNFEFI